METLIYRPSRSLQYFAIAKQWSLDLDFFQAELVFLNRLLDDYFISLSTPHGIDKLTGIKKDLRVVEAYGRKTEELLNPQIVFLEMMSDDVIPDDVQSLEAKQISLEYLMNDLNNAFRKTKKALFKLIEEVVQKDEI